MPLSRRTMLITALGAAAACTTRTQIDTTESASIDRQLPLGTLLTVRPPVTSVGMVGDSITAASEADLRSSFAASGVLDVTIDAESGRRIEVGNGTSEPLSGHRALQRLLDAGLSPGAWVIALGTNDVSGYDRDGYGQLIDTLLGLLPAGTPLVWVDTYRPKALEHTELFNAVLADRLNSRGNAAVASWFALASQPSSQLLRDDNLHPNRAGRAAFAGLVAGAVRSLD